jgi:hypothetical protein
MPNSLHLKSPTLTERALWLRASSRLYVLGLGDPIGLLRIDDTQTAIVQFSEVLDPLLVGVSQIDVVGATFL